MKTMTLNTSNFDIDDKKIMRDIQERIRWDIRVSTSDLYIKVKNGVVTLFGYFDKPFRHVAALHILRATEGVREIRDESQTLQDYHRTDRELEVLLIKQVRELPLKDGEWIDVNVKRGVVRLEGWVYRSHIKGFASRAAWEMSGIRDCVNDIIIGEPQTQRLEGKVSFMMPNHDIVEANEFELSTQSRR